MENPGTSVLVDRPPRANGLRAYLQLIRLPNVFTAAADSVAGWLILGGGVVVVRAGSGIGNGLWIGNATWVWLAAASACIYAAGIALNDYADYAIDLRERPHRPLPSGMIPRRHALMMASVFFGMGIGSAWIAGGALTGSVAAVLVGLVMLYDLVAKTGLLGPLVMGSCRGGNLLMGMSAAAVAQDWTWTWNGVTAHASTLWLCVPALMVFVTGITWISRNETLRDRREGVLIGLVLQNIAFALWFAAVVTPTAPGFAGGLMLLLFAFLVNQAGAKALIDAQPAMLQAAVKTGVLSIIWLDAAVVLAARNGWDALLLILIFWIPAYLVGKWLYTT